MPDGKQADGIFGNVDAAEDLLRLFQEIAAGFGEPDLPRRALEELDAEPLLQLQHDRG